MVDNFYDIQPHYPEEDEGLYRCACHYKCDSYKENEMVKGHEDDLVYMGHISQYLDNFKSDLSNEDYDLLTKKIEKQCQTKTN